MPPTLKQLTGHIAFGAFVHVCVGHTFCTYCNFDPYFFFSELSPLLELWPFENFCKKSCQQDISKSLLARGLKLGQLIGDDE